MRGYETHVYKKLKRWFKEPDEKKDLENRINDASGDYERILIQEYLKKDFLRTTIVMSGLACENIPDETNGCLKDIIGDIIGFVIGEIIYETTEISKLNKILKVLAKESKNDLDRWIYDRRKGRVWIKGTFIDQIIEETLSFQLRENKIEILPKKWRITFGEFVKYDLALILGTNMTEVKAMLAYGIPRSYLHNIFYGSIMLRILMEGLKDDLYVTWLGDVDLFIGESGVSHFFDGIITLGEKGKENPWLLKCISTYSNPLDAIESVDTKLDDMGVNKCILFLPMYPSQNALRYALYKSTKGKNKVIMLYLKDLYKLIVMEDDKVKDYLLQKVL